MTYYAFINIFKKQKNKIIAHETVQNQAMLFSHFFIVWIRINKVVKYGSNLDPDPQHCSPSLSRCCCGWEARWSGPSSAAGSGMGTLTTIQC